ncbi:type III secretion protein [Stutzerimonas zhaodongensis]|uniref:type III secretion protein n=1 Tax=Stutzerimonas zhaodongensis TaxID=1176257 RepID=UPI0039EF9C41
MTGQPKLVERWQAVAAQPLNYVQPERLNECFAHSLNAEQLNALLARSRFRTRVERLLSDHFKLVPLSQPRVEADLRIMLLAVEQLPRLALLCGATWHANALAREIRGTAVHALKNKLGSDVFEFALAHRNQAGAVGVHFEAEQLLEAIERDGEACVRAWLCSLPDDLHRWLRLRLDSRWLQFSDFPPEGITLIREIAAKEFAG